MNVALWIIAGLLAVTFLASGAMKLIWPKEKLAAAGMGFVEDFSAGTVKAIGTLEVLAAVGLIALAVLVAWGRFGPQSFTGCPTRPDHRQTHHLQIVHPGVIPTGAVAAANRRSIRAPSSSVLANLSAGGDPWLRVAESRADSR
jgi:hypothetical protein